MTDTDEKIARVREASNDRIDELQRQNLNMLLGIHAKIDEAKVETVATRLQVVGLEGKVQMLTVRMGTLCKREDLILKSVELKEKFERDLKSVFADSESDLKTALEEHERRKHKAGSGSPPPAEENTIKLTLPFKIASGSALAGSVGMLIYYLIRYFFGV